MNEWVNNLPLRSLGMLIYKIMSFSRKEEKKKVWTDRQFIAQSGVTPHESKVIYTVVSNLQNVAMNQKKKNECTKRGHKMHILLIRQKGPLNYILL